MEAAVFKDRSKDFPLPKSDSQSLRPSSQNGFHSARIQIPDIEMMIEQSASSSTEYTSLKDLLQAAGTAMSPTPSSSWHEIPIRNPLVKHAAMAYLQPMSTPTTSFGDRGGFLGRLKETWLCGCGGEYGCFGWLCDVVSRMVKEVFGELVLDRRKITDSAEEEEEDYDDEEDEDDEKVD